jgi:major type 1 subunit fimbrin (pilin)
MKKLSLGAALVSALLVSMGANAQTPPTTGNQSGTITFTGSINTDACVVTGGTSATRNNITVDMGSVSMFAVGTQANPTGTGTLLDAEPVAVDLDIRCAAGTNVTFLLSTPNPAGDGGNSIGNTLDAGNVAVSLYRPNGSLIPLGAVDPAERTLAAALVAGRTTLSVNAYYTRVDVDPAVLITPGRTSGMVNYTLAYN